MKNKQQMKYWRIKRRQARFFGRIVMKNAPLILVDIYLDRRKLFAIAVESSNKHCCFVS